MGLFRKRPANASPNHSSPPPRLALVHLGNPITGAKCATQIMGQSSLGSHFLTSRRISEVTCTECIEIAQPFQLPAQTRPDNGLTHLPSWVQLPWCGAEPSPELVAQNGSPFLSIRIVDIEIVRDPEGKLQAQAAPINPDPTILDADCPECLSIANDVGLKMRPPFLPDEARNLLIDSEQMMSYVRFHIDYEFHKLNIANYGQEGNLILTNERIFCHVSGLSAQPFIQCPISDVTSVDYSFEGRNSHPLEVVHKYGSIRGKSFGVSRQRLSAFAETLEAHINR